MSSGYRFVVVVRKGTRRMRDVGQGQDVKRSVDGDGDGDGDSDGRRWRWRLGMTATAASGRQRWSERECGNERLGSDRFKMRLDEV